MPSHRDVRETNVDLKRLGAVLAVAYEREFHDFASLLLLEKLGPRTLRSLALVAEVVHVRSGADDGFSRDTGDLPTAGNVLQMHAWHENRDDDEHKDH
jgi:hypothetical protein